MYIPRTSPNIRKPGFSFLCGLVAFFLLRCEVRAAAATPPTARTTQGEVVGKWILDGTQKAFLGLPYAAPPIGQLRWRAPQPAAGWKGIRDGTKFAGRCQQWHIWNDYIFLDPGPTEDCLYLNVYVPGSAKQTSKLPVMLWIHGGGFAAGASSELRYTNSALVAKGVILVTINYRLNVFGFLASEDLAKQSGGHAGNYGLMDVVAALQWVHANIAAFGGDPGNVTIFGESAGSFAVNALTTAPQAHGLFQKFIGESGAFFGSAIPMMSTAERAKRDQKWVDSVGAKNLDELRKLPAEKLVAAAQRKGVIGFAPVIDGVLLPEAVPDAYAGGRQAHVPAIIGWNRDERSGILSQGLTAAKWKAYANEHYGENAAQFLTAFPGDSEEQAVRSADDFTTDSFIAMGGWKWAEADAKTGQAPVYRYRFDRPAPAEPNHPEGRYAFHSDELEYVFGTLDVRQGAVWQPADRKLSEQMIGYWTNFARTGDPNGRGLPQWPRYDTQGGLIHFDDPITAGPDRSRGQFEFLSQQQPSANASPTGAR